MGRVQIKDTNNIVVRRSSCNKSQKWLILQILISWIRQYLKAWSSKNSQKEMQKDRWPWNSKSSSVQETFLNYKPNLLTRNLKAFKDSLNHFLPLLDHPLSGKRFKDYLLMLFYLM